MNRNKRNVSQTKNTDESKSMSPILSVTVIFQGISNDKFSSMSSPNRILLHPIDFKVLGIKLGSYVKIDFKTVVICQAWVSNSLTSGTCFMYKIWKSCLASESTTDNKRKVHVTKISSGDRILECSSCDFRVTNTLQQQLIESELFSSYVKSSISNAVVTINHMLNLTWGGKPILLQVVKLANSSTPCSAAHNNDDSIVQFYMISPQTRLSFYRNDASSMYEINSSTSSKFCSSTNLLELLNAPGDTTILPQFGGYKKQIRECLSLIHYGLFYKNSGNCLNNNEGNESETELHQKYLYTPETANPIDSSKNGRSKLSDMLFKPPRGLLLYGPPGTGKSRLMRELAAVCGCAVEEILPDILLLRDVGEAEKALREVFERASRQSPCLLLVEDLHCLCRSRSAATVTDLQKRLVSCILSLLDGGEEAVSRTGKVFLLATTSRPQDVDQAMRRPGRLDKEVELEVPSSSDREDILNVLLTEMGVDIIRDTSSEAFEGPVDNKCIGQVSVECVRSVAANAHGMVGADLLLVCKYMHIAALERMSCMTSQRMDRAGTMSSREFDLTQQLAGLSLDVSKVDSGVAGAPYRKSERVVVCDSDLLVAAQRVSPSALRESTVEVPEVRWADIGGMEQVKQQLREVVEWPLLHQALFESMGLSPPRGVLLYGPPGCSKTLLAKAVATESSMNFLAVRGPELLSKWLGESEKAVQSLFRKARGCAPSLIFFDEIDALASKRGAGSGGVNDRVLAQLLTEMDGGLGSGRVVVIAATNRPDMLDPALLRPGRFDRKVYVPPPDNLSRRKILELQLCKLPLENSFKTDLERNLDKLVEMTRCFSGAEVVAVCTEGAMLAMDEEVVDGVENDVVSMENVITAVTATIPQITPSMLCFYENIQKEFQI